jgi:hypothetical protein
MPKLAPFLGRLLCRLGFHNFRVLNKTFEFGGGGRYRNGQVQAMRYHHDASDMIVPGIVICWRGRIAILDQSDAKCYPSLER